MQLYQLMLVMGVLVVALAAVAFLLWRSLRSKGADPAEASAARRSRPSLPRVGLRDKAPEPMPDEPAPAIAAERRRKIVPASIAEAAEQAQSAKAPFSEEVFGKLEQAFEAYHRNSISLETYSALVLAEQQAVERRIHQLRAELAEGEPGDEQTADLADAESAREAVRWCIDWAYERARTEQGAPG